MISLLRKIADNRQAGSPAVKFRKQRFTFFLTLLAQLRRPLSILDIGGTELFWQTMGFEDEEGVTITLLNLQGSELSARENYSGRTEFHRCLGDGRRMPEFRDGEFDIVFSNSVIEHVGDFGDQQKMFGEICRVGKRFFVQTPNFYFPIEPHFLVPGFQFLPLSVRAYLLQHFSLGWTHRVADRDEARTVASSVRLLTLPELRRLAPEAKIYHERFFGLSKSFVAYGGWERQGTLEL